jgi:CRP/FNR family transcriptional regulator, anaerobic regulatory protein
MTSSTFDRLCTHIQSVTPVEASELASLEEHFEPAVLRRRDYLYRQGENCRWFAFMLSGCLRSFHTDERGEEFTLYFGFADWWVGDSESFFGGGPSRVSGQALEDCEILRADRASFERAITTVPAFGRFYGVKMQRSYAAAQKKLVETHVQSAEEKYRRLLLTAPDIVQRIPQSYIASYLGIRPQSLSRIRRKISVPPRRT